MMRRRACSLGIIAVVLAAGLTALPGIGAATPAQAAPAGSGGWGPLYAESFAGARVQPGSWTEGGTPCLTAGRGDRSGIRGCGFSVPDRAGAGVLRLTGNGRQQSGWVLSNRPLNASSGLDVSFDMYQYDTTTRIGADGIAFVLFDASRQPQQVGQAGGWLGYRGLGGAYLGIGFDEWGNFSNRALWDSGPGKLVPDTIAVRGAGDAGYPYLIGMHAPQLAVDGTSHRYLARRHIDIRVSVTGVVTVRLSRGHQTLSEISGLSLDDVPGQPPLPATVRIGFASATGDNTAIHEVSGLVVRQLSPDLVTTIRPSGQFRATGTGMIVATVSDRRAGGPTTGPVTARIAVPGALSPRSAQGAGWGCSIGGQVVSCSRPDVLQPGSSFPPIDVVVAVARSAPRRLTVQSSAITRYMHLSPGNASRATVPVEAAPPSPHLSVAIEPAGPLVAGGTGVVHLQVSNAPRAGTTTGPVRLGFRIPPGDQVTDAAGPGWTCGVQAATANCDRPDALPGDGKFQPVDVTSVLCQKPDCGLAGAVATVQTPGAPVATATVGPGDVTVARRSNLGLSLSTNPIHPQYGFDVTYTAVITNGGPTDVQDAQLDVRVPRGFSGQWTCKAERGSGCPAGLGVGPVHTQLYVASGGTVTVTATGQAAGTAAEHQTVSATLYPPDSYTDLSCSQRAPCTASGDAATGDVSH